MKRKLKEYYPHLAGLPNESLKVVAGIEKWRPSWLGYAAQAEYQGTRHLEITIQPNRGKTELRIYDLNERLTVAFGGWHMHAYFYRGLEQAIKTAVDAADAVMSETWIIAATEASETSFGAYTHQDFAQIPLQDLVYSRSWHGTYDMRYRDPRSNTAWIWELAAQADRFTDTGLARQTPTNEFS